jgi:predicted deacetylase
MTLQARYLVRFDDLCPTMNWTMWARVEAVLIERGIRPLLAVIPDNQDKSLAVAPAHAAFWKEVRRWQALGWTIGLHGYQHLFVNQNPGIVGIQRRSEFAGLPAAEQERKLRRALEIFRGEGVEPQVWIAPAHSFDQNTVVALAKTGVTVISDGLAIAPHTDETGIFWIPQQIWQFRWRPFGVWTVCYHHNRWGEKQFNRFLQDIRKNQAAITDLSAVRDAYRSRQRGVMDRVYSMAHSAVLSCHGRPGAAS